MGSKLLLEEMQLNFSFRNKFIILLPCCLLEDRNTFSKMRVFKVLLATLIMVVISPLNAELIPICHLLALLKAHLISHVSRVRVKEVFCVHS